MSAVSFPEAASAAAAFAVAPGLLFRCRACGQAHRVDGYDWIRCLAVLNAGLVRDLGLDISEERPGRASLAFAEEVWHRWVRPAESSLLRSLVSCPWLLAIDPSVPLEQALGEKYAELQAAVRGVMRGKEEHRRWVAELERLRPPARVAALVPAEKDAGAVARVAVAPAMLAPAEGAPAVIDVPACRFLDHIKKHVPDAGSARLLWVGYGPRAFAFLACNIARGLWLECVEPYGGEARVRCAKGGFGGEPPGAEAVRRRVLALAKRCGLGADQAFPGR
jgi:hypothetical protein